MPRYTLETEGNPISVSFGIDSTTGVFISVTDTRVRYDTNASAAVNKVTESVGMIGDGGGCYLAMHTAKSGFGLRVDNVTMATYLRRYGVTLENDHGIIASLESTPEDATRRVCHVCGKPGKFKCAKCGYTNYCSRECQKSAWKVHKVHCPMLGNVSL
jgi:peroxiredoxin